MTEAVVICRDVIGCGLPLIACSGCAECGVPRFFHRIEAVRLHRVSGHDDFCVRILFDFSVLGQGESLENDNIEPAEAVELYA